MNETKKSTQASIGLKEVQLTQQQASQLIALFLFLAFFIFIAGYYWGKKNGMVQLTDRLVSESLTDKLNHAFCALHDSDNEDGGACADYVAGDTNQNSTQEGVSQTHEGEALPISSNLDASQSNENSVLYYGQLGNFNTRQSAQKYAKKLSGFGVKIIEKNSVSNKKHQKIWYQVITPLYLQKHEVQSFIDTLQREARLSKGVVIATINKSHEKELKLI